MKPLLSFEKIKWNLTYEHQLGSVSMGFDISFRFPSYIPYWTCTIARWACSPRNGLQLIENLLKCVQRNHKQPRQHAKGLQRSASLCIYHGFKFSAFMWFLSVRTSESLILEPAEVCTRWRKNSEHKHSSLTQAISNC